MALPTLRTISLSALVVLAAACGASKLPAAPIEPKGETASAPAPRKDGPTLVTDAATSYRIRSGLSSPEAVVGKKANFTLFIQPTRPDVHVQAEFPLKVTLSSDAGLDLEKKELGHKDAQDVNAPSRRWEVGFTARTPGKHVVTAKMRFAICREGEPAWCVTRDETVATGFEAR